MTVRHACSAIAAALLTCAVVGFTDTSAQTSSPTSVKDGTPITLIGCIQRETDYRRDHHSGRGGAFATGAGLANEYVLVNASKGTAAPTATNSDADFECATSAPGDAYELTGDQEHNLKPFVGRRVEIMGMLKPAKLEKAPAGTAGSTEPRPTGGFDPIGQDLKLFEVEVASFGPVPAGPQAVAEQPPTPVQPEQQPAARVATSQRLPRTASPLLPFSGLVGLLSFGGALGVRVFGRNRN